MNAGPDVERRVSDWLAEEVPTRAPDRILPAAFERTRHARQRRFGAAWRSISMNRTWQLATAAVVGVLIIGLGAVYFGGRQAGVGGPPVVDCLAEPQPDRRSRQEAVEAGHIPLIDRPFTIDGMTVTLDGRLAPLDGGTAARQQLSIPEGDTSRAWRTFKSSMTSTPIPAAHGSGPTIDHRSDRPSTTSSRRTAP